MTISQLRFKPFNFLDCIHFINCRTVLLYVYVLSGNNHFSSFIFVELQGRMAETQTLNFGPEW